ncbi:MAG: Hsp70 family protein [Rhodococcus sp. (in: high G+C Gram-positive bacteria)]
MTAVYGISVGSAALRLVRTDSSAISAGVVSFEMKVVDTYDQPTRRDIADSVYALPPEGGVPAPATVSTSAARRDEVRGLLSDAPGADVVDDTRAALAFVDFAWLADGYRTFALLDVGATGSSVTVVDTETRQRTATVRSAAGAGCELDRMVVEHLLQAGIVDRPATEDAEREITTFARSVKESLSSSVLARAYGGEVELMTRARLDEVAADMVTACAQNVVDASRESGATVDVVILVGGTARMPLMRSTVEDMLDVPVVIPDEPEAVVAKGAGLIAGMRPSPEDEPTYVETAWLGGDDEVEAEGPDRAATSPQSPSPKSPSPKSSSSKSQPSKSQPAKSQPAKSQPAKSGSTATGAFDLDSAETEILEQIRMVDLPTADGSHPDAIDSLSLVTSPYDSPTRPFAALDDHRSPGPAVVGAAATASHGFSAPVFSDPDLTPGHGVDNAQEPPAASMRIPRIAALFLTAVAVASGVLWAVIQPGVDPISAPAAVTEDAVAATSTFRAPPPSPVSLPPVPVITTTEVTEETEQPAYTAPRTSTRTFEAPSPAFTAPDTFDVQTPEFSSPNSQSPDVQPLEPTSTEPTTDTIPLQQLPVPPLFQVLPIPGF